jgi:hypothetical protein
VLISFRGFELYLERFDLVLSIIKTFAAIVEASASSSIAMSSIDMYFACYMTNSTIVTVARSIGFVSTMATTIVVTVAAATTIS